jgi:hypothetical protein
MYRIYENFSYKLVIILKTLQEKFSYIPYIFTAFEIFVGRINVEISKKHLKNVDFGPKRAKNVRPDKLSVK